MYKIFSFRPRDFIFPYKRAAYQAPATTISTPPSDDPAGEDPSDPPPQKRQRVIQSHGATAAPSQGTIRSNTTRYGSHSYSLGFFFGI